MSKSALVYLVKMAMVATLKRKWIALTLLSLVLCALITMQVDGYRRVSVDEEEDDEDEDQDDEFDFMSSTLSEPRRPATSEAVDEASCDAGTGQCAAPTALDSVFQRGLVTPKPKAQDILREHSRCGSELEPRFQGEVLGYVTPWNGKGYEFAKKYRTKFTYIAPVWLQIRENANTNTPIVTGTHDIDRQWVKDVRGDTATSGPRIVPRVMYERNKLSHTDVPIIIDELLALARKESFDGFVFEIPISKGTMDLLVRMGDAFNKANKLLILVLIRSNNDGRLPLTPQMLDELEPYVHRYTMNAYDFQTPGPNAPYKWIRTTLERMRTQDKKKILVGLPFYGYDNGDAIVGTSHLEHLRDHDNVKIRWDASERECYYRYDSARDGSKHTVYYPCLQFLQDRLQLFHDNDIVGTAVWELGQGLEYFYDLL